MKLRTLLFVVAILAALSVAVFVAQRPPLSLAAGTRLGEPLVDTALIEKAARLRVTDQGKTVSLARQPDGTWRVTSFFDLPADFSKITGLVVSLTDAKIQRLVTTKAERIDRLGLKDTQVVLLDAADKELWSVMLGKNADGGGRFVRYGAEQKAYLASFNGSLDAESKNWVNPELLGLKAEDIAQAEIATGEGESILISRANKDAAWISAQTPAGRKINANKVFALLASVGNLRFTETSDLNDPGFAAAKANARVCKLTTFDGKTVTVTFSHKPEEKAPQPPAITDAKTGSAGSGPVADPTKQGILPTPNGGPIPGPAKGLVPGFASVPANPVFVVIAHSDVSASVNTIMQKCAFQIAAYTFASLPQKADELFELVLPTAPEKSTNDIKAEPKTD